jgi:F0F1-type ATP synthase delta subunit
MKGDLRAWKGLENLEGILKAAIGRLENLEGILKVAIGRLESLEERLKASICESLEGRLKATIVIFNHHWRAKEVGS